MRADSGQAEHRFLRSLNILLVLTAADGLLLRLYPNRGASGVVATVADRLAQHLAPDVGDDRARKHIRPDHIDGLSRKGSGRALAKYPLQCGCFTCVQR